MKILQELKDLIPPLTTEEYNTLEESILAEGVRDRLVVWGDTLIDGHNRYAICKEHNIPFETQQLEFDNLEQVKVWMIDNQKGRRNLTDGWKFELAQAKKKILAYKHEEERKLRRVSNVDTREKEAESGRTRKELANELGWSTGKVAMADKVWKEADEETKEAVRSGEKSINQAYKDVRKKEIKQSQDQYFEELKQKELQEITEDYDVIVIDPPWDMKKIDRDVAPNQTGFDYPTMTIEEIKEFDLPNSDNCHVFMWITQKHLPHGFEIFNQWGVKYVFTMVWHKNGGFQPFGLAQYNCEFVLYGRIGSPKFIDLKAFPTCFSAKRTKHSEKPNEFYDIIRRVTAGKKIDIFNRRDILGFDKWGNEAE